MQRINDLPKVTQVMVGLESGPQKLGSEARLFIGIFYSLNNWKVGSKQTTKWGKSHENHTLYDQVM